MSPRERPELTADLATEVDTSSDGDEGMLAGCWRGIRRHCGESAAAAHVLWSRWLIPRLNRGFVPATGRWGRLYPVRSA